MASEKIERVVALRSASHLAGDMFVLTFGEKGQSDPLVMSVVKKDVTNMLSEVKIALHHDLKTQPLPPGHVRVVRINLGSKHFGKPDEELLMSVANAEKFVEILEHQLSGE